MFKKNKDILNIALPAMGENFLQMLMGMVDSYLVAHLGLIAISGVSVAGNIITIYQAILSLWELLFPTLFQKFGAERSVQVGLSRDRGSQDNPIAECTFRRFIHLCWARDDRTLGTEQEVAESGGLYLSLVGGSIVLLGLMTSLGALIRATHNPTSASLC